MNSTVWIKLGAILAAASVGLGAFGAHGLKGAVEAGTFSTAQLTNFETAVRYQMYHAIALVLLGALPTTSRRLSNVAGGAFLIGILLFCGCLYGYIFLQSSAESTARAFVRVVPVGGVGFIVGWIALAMAVKRTGEPNM